MERHLDGLTARRSVAALVKGVRPSIEAALYRDGNLVAYGTGTTGTSGR